MEFLILFFRSLILAGILWYSLSFRHSQSRWPNGVKAYYLCRHSIIPRLSNPINLVQKNASFSIFQLYCSTVIGENNNFWEKSMFTCTLNKIGKIFSSFEVVFKKNPEDCFRLNKLRYSVQPLRVLEDCRGQTIDNIIKQSAYIS